MPYQKVGGGMDEQQVGIVVFRLNQMENSIEEINTKLDQLLGAGQQYRTDMALIQQVQNQQEIRIDDLRKRTEALQNMATDLRISLAEKIGPGAIAGVAGAIIIGILQFLMGM